MAGKKRDPKARAGHFDSLIEEMNNCPPEEFGILCSHAVEFVTGGEDSSQKPQDIYADDIAQVQKNIADRTEIGADPRAETRVVEVEVVEEVKAEKVKAEELLNVLSETESTKVYSLRQDVSGIMVPPEVSASSGSEVLFLQETASNSDVRAFAIGYGDNIAEEKTSPLVGGKTIQRNRTELEKEFSEAQKKVSSLVFLDNGHKDEQEDFFRKFINDCQERLSGREVLYLIFAHILKNKDYFSAEKKEAFIQILRTVIEKPGKNIWESKHAAKGSPVGTWHKGIDLILENCLKVLIGQSDSVRVMPHPTMDFSHAMEQILDSKDFQERLQELLIHFYIKSDRKMFFSELITLILSLEKSSKYEEKDFIIDTLSELDFEFTVRLEMEINRIKVEENKKIIAFPSTKTGEKKAITQETSYTNEHISETNEEINEEKKKKGVLMAFLNKYRGRLAMFSGALALLGIVGVSAYTSKNENTQKEDEGLPNKVDPKEVAQGISVSGVNGVSGLISQNSEQIVSFDEMGQILISAANGATDGIAVAQKEKIESESLDTAIASAGNFVQKAQEEALLSQKEKVSETVEWSYQVKEGDTFFKVTEDWKAHYGFSEARDKYKFLQKIDNWDISTALRLIFNKENGRNRDLDVYKGSDRDIADTFRATPYQIFMEIYKFQSRSQRNFVKKYMENGGDFDVILASIDRGFFIAENGEKIPLSVEIKKKFEQKKVSLMKRYHKRRGSIKDIKATEVIIDETFKFASQKTRTYILDKLNAGEKIANVMTWITKGWALDFETNKAVEIKAFVKKSPERKTYKLDTELGVIKGKKAIEQYLAGVEEANRQKEISQNLEASEKDWAEIEREVEIANNLEASEKAWEDMLAEKEMEEAWEHILENIEIVETSPDEIASGTKNEILESMNA
ncbi:MAG: hypothetical protein RBS56_01050 [Candidatus Gracilibacteria bacterium]|jgi:hypothetical protein|nr:hypothetical protein [Candidatus Gracilibacteria bacterium]